MNLDPNILDLKRDNLSTPTQTTREFTREQQTPVREFEQCGTNDTCSHREFFAEPWCTTNLEVEGDLAEMENVPTLSDWEVESWTGQSLASLSSHIVTNYHGYAKRELPRLALLAEEVVDHHGSTTTELPVIAATLARLDEDLTLHLANDEMVLFPYIADLERRLSCGIAPPHRCFEVVADPIARMKLAHDAAGTLLREIRQLSHDFSAPEDACPTFHAFYDGLRGLEQHLYQGIRLENDVLFPRALVLEDSIS